MLPDCWSGWEQYAGVTVDRSFDVWSLGMAILHLYLGRGYFEGSSDPQVVFFFRGRRVASFSRRRTLVPGIVFGLVCGVHANVVAHPDRKYRECAVVTVVS